MAAFWRNPEFVRHVRAELRPPRAIAAAMLVLVICALVALSCWASERHNSREFFRLLHSWLLGIQYTVLGLWCAAACGQAISRERELKTFDFLRTTRLTSAELLVGKILGAPIMAYFVVGCSLPISVLAGILGGIPLRVLLWVYLLLVGFTVFLSLVSLWGSMLAEKASGGAIGFLAMVLPALPMGLAETPFPGLGALSIFLPVLSLYGADFQYSRAKPPLLGVPMTLPLMAVLLYTLLGAWFVLMLVRNLKKDRDQMRLLSRWQAVGFAAFLNALFYALLDPGRVNTSGGFNMISPRDVAVIAVVLNSLILFLMGVATVTPREKLKTWWRRHAMREEPYLSEYGLPWPWLVPAAAIAYGLLLAEAAGFQRTIPFGAWRMGAVAVQFFIFLVFIARDILFLQWSCLTRMKRPLFKGFLYLCLYYAAVGVLGLVVSVVSEKHLGYVASLTPYFSFTEKGVGLRASPEIYIGLALQVPLVFVLLNAISNRLSRPATTPAMLSA